MSAIEMQVIPMDDGLEHAERIRKLRIREQFTKERNLQNAPIAVVAKKMFSLDIVTGQIRGSKTLIFFILLAVLNFIRHASFLKMSRQQSIYYGNYFFLWNDEDYVIHYGIMLGQAITVGCLSPFAYFVICQPNALIPILNILATVHGMTPSSLPVKTINNLRRQISKYNMMLRLIVVLMIVFLIQLIYMGYSLLDEDDILLSGMIWPLVQITAAFGTCVATFGTSILYLAQNLVFEARLRQLDDELVEIKTKLLKYQNGKWKSWARRIVAIWAAKRTLALLNEYDQIQREIAACNLFWKKPALGIALCMPSITLCLYFLVVKGMNIVCIWITVATIVSLSILGGLFLFSAAAVTKQSNKCYATLNSIYVRSDFKNHRVRQHVSEAIKQFTKEVGFTVNDCVNMKYCICIPLVDKMISNFLLMVLGIP